MEMGPAKRHESNSVNNKSFVEKTKNFFRREKTFDDKLLRKRTDAFATEYKRRHKSHDANKVRRNHIKNDGRKSIKRPKNTESKKFYGHVEEVIYCEVTPSMPFRMTNDKSVTKLRDIFKRHELRDRNEFGGDNFPRKSQNKDKSCSKSRNNSKQKHARTNSKKNDDSGNTQKLPEQYLSPLATQRHQKATAGNEGRGRKRHKRENTRSSKENKIEDGQNPGEEKQQKKRIRLVQKYDNLTEKIEEDMKIYFAQIQMMIDKKLDVILQSQKLEQMSTKTYFPLEEGKTKRERKKSKKVNNAQHTTSHGEISPSTQSRKVVDTNDKDNGTCCLFDRADPATNVEMRKHFKKYRNSEISGLLNQKLQELLGGSTVERPPNKNNSTECKECNICSARNGEYKNWRSANIQKVLDQHSSRQEFVVQGIEPPSLERNIERSNEQLRPRKLECKTVSIIGIIPSSHRKKSKMERETQTEKKKSSKIYLECSTLETEISHEEKLHKGIVDNRQFNEDESSEILKGHCKKNDLLPDFKRCYFNALSSSNSDNCFQMLQKTGRTSIGDKSKLKIDPRTSLKGNPKISRSKSDFTDKPFSINDSMTKKSRSGNPQIQRTSNKDEGLQTSKIKVEVQSTAVGGDKKHHRHVHTSIHNVRQMSRGTSARKMDAAINIVKKVDVAISPRKSPKRCLKEAAVGVSYVDLVNAPAKLTRSRGVSPINIRGIHLTKPVMVPTPKPRNFKQSGKIRIASHEKHKTATMGVASVEETPLLSLERANVATKSFDVQCTTINPKSRKSVVKTKHITQAKIPTVDPNHSAAVSPTCNQSNQNAIDVCFHLPYSENEESSRKRESCTLTRSITANAMLENANSVVNKVSTTTSSSAHVRFVRKSKSLVEIRPRMRNNMYNESNSEVGSRTRSTLEKFANQPKQRLQSQRSNAQSLDQYLGKFTSRLFLTKDYKGSQVSSYQRRKLYDDSIRKRMKKKFKLSKNSIGPQIYEVRFLSMLENKDFINRSVRSAIHSIDHKDNNIKPAMYTDVPHSLAALRTEKSNVGKVTEIYVNNKEHLMVKFWRKLLAINSTVAIPEGFEENQCSCTTFSRNCTACKNFVTLLDLFSSSMSTYCKNGGHSQVDNNTESTSEATERIMLAPDCDSVEICYKSRMNDVNNSTTGMRSWHVPTYRDGTYLTYPTSCPILASRVSSFEYLYERDSNDTSREMVFANLTRPFGQIFRFNPSQYNVETHFSRRNTHSSPCSSEESGYGSVKSKQTSSLDNFFKKPNIAALFTPCSLGTTEFCTINHQDRTELEEVVTYDTMVEHCQLNSDQVQEKTESCENEEEDEEFPLSMENDYSNCLEMKSTYNNIVEVEQEPAVETDENKIELSENGIKSTSSTAIDVRDIASISESMVENVIKASSSEIAEEAPARGFFNILLKIYEKEVHIRKQLFEDLIFHECLISAVEDKRNQEKKWKSKLRNILKKKEEKNADTRMPEGTDGNLISELRDQLPDAKRCLIAIAQVAQISKSLEEELKINALMKLLKRIEMGDWKVAQIFQDLENGNLQEEVRAQVLQLFINTCHGFYAGTKLHRQKLSNEELNLVKIFACKYGLMVEENLSITVANYIAKKVINSERRLRAAVAYLMRPKAETMDAISFETFICHEE
ncbi:uncharacterized protein LOC132703231 [Cylas formicarius]|uniref:uncharacterized protein LOC132703231 n=1 Tax=Cylas formicarius TaxID=197179 RepID=UPI002958D3EC|nr:uncharacterized protein LOC132703231 [Cylas formicarius]